METKTLDQLREERRKKVASLNMVEAMLSGMKNGHPQRSYYIKQKATLLQEMKDLKDEIYHATQEADQAQFKQPDVAISDHAVIRYLERMHGLPMDKVRQKVVPEEVKKAILSHRKLTTWAVVHQGIAYVVRGWMVVTIIPNPDPQSDSMQDALFV